MLKGIKEVILGGDDEANNRDDFRIGYDFAKMMN